jgi:repressor LexA
MKINEKRDKLFAYLQKKKGNLSMVSLREIGEAIGLGEKEKVNPQLIAHHLSKLEETGYIRRTNPEKRIYEVLKKPVDDIVYIKLYNVTAQCGPDGILGEDNIKEEIPLHSKTFGISNPNDYFLIKARGDSMEPMIHSGDLVLVRTQATIDNGQIGVIVHNEEPKIKQLSRSKNGYILTSLNRKFSIEEAEEEDLHIVGLVKSIIRNGI